MSKDRQTEAPTRRKCAYCRVELDRYGQPASGFEHAEDCADRPLSKADLKQLTDARSRTMVGQIAPRISISEDLLRVVNSPLRGVVESLLEHLAALCDLAHPHRASQTDRPGRYRDVHSPMPSFTPAEADRRLREAEQRLHDEVLKLSGATRNPRDPQEPQCVECGKRGTVVDSYCQPCGARILKEHRRNS